MNSPVQNHGRSHVPVSKTLPGEGIPLAAKIEHQPLELFIVLGPELGNHELPRRPHQRFAAKIVKLHEGLGIVSSCLVCIGHESSPNDASRSRRQFPSRDSIIKTNVRAIIITAILESLAFELHPSVGVETR